MGMVRFTDEYIIRLLTCQSKQCGFGISSVSSNVDECDDMFTIQYNILPTRYELGMVHDVALFKQRAITITITITIASIPFPSLSPLLHPHPCHYLHPHPHPHLINVRHYQIQAIVCKWSLYDHWQAHGDGEIHSFLQNPNHKMVSNLGFRV